MIIVIFVMILIIINDDGPLICQKVIYAIN